MRVVSFWKDQKVSVWRWGIGFFFCKRVEFCVSLLRMRVQAVEDINQAS